MKINFISYSGSFPNLCCGVLIIEIDKTRYELAGVMVSGGSVYFSDDYRNEHIEEGDWFIPESRLPDNLKSLVTEITEVVNENVPKGCCGGCL